MKINLGVTHYCARIGSDKLPDIAACHVYKEILEKLWFWAKEQQIDLQYDLLLAKIRI